MRAAPAGALTAFVGDEITLHGDWAEWFPERDTVTIAASGALSDDLVAGRDELIATAPASVVLLAGTNDLTRKKSAEHVVRNLQFLMVTLRKELPGARLLLHSVPPREAERADVILDANRHLRQFCPSINAQFLDLWPALADDHDQLAPGLSDDGVHLNALGYEAWLSDLRPALERLDEAPPMTRPITVITPPYGDD